MQSSNAKMAATEMPVPLDCEAAQMGCPEGWRKNNKFEKKNVSLASWKLLGRFLSQGLRLPCEHITKTETIMISVRNHLSTERKRILLILTKISVICFWKIIFPQNRPNHINLVIFFKISLNHKLKHLMILIIILNFEFCFEKRVRGVHRQDAIRHRRYRGIRISSPLQSSWRSSSE